MYQGFPLKGTTAITSMAMNKNIMTVHIPENIRAVVYVNLYSHHTDPEPDEEQPPLVVGIPGCQQTLKMEFL